MRYTPRKSRVAMIANLKLSNDSTWGEQKQKVRLSRNPPKNTTVSITGLGTQSRTGEHLKMIQFVLFKKNY